MVSTKKPQKYENDCISEMDLLQNLNLNGPLMALSTIVKINQVNNLSDARYCAGMGVAMIGFDLDPYSSNPIAPEVFEGITGWLSGVELVGEFHQADLRAIERTISQFDLDHIETERIELLQDLKDQGLSVLLKINLDEFSRDELNDLLETKKSLVKYFMITSDKDLFPAPDYLKLIIQYPVLIGSGISRQNLGQIKENAITGIALTGGDEISPGYKDFDELADILEELEIEG